MNVILDANAPDFGYAMDHARHGAYVFVAQGNPAVTPSLMRGISHVRKNIAPVWTSIVYEGQGETFVIPALDILSFSKEVGIQQWDVVRLSGDDVPAILAKWPGPISRKIETTVALGEVASRHLRQWYREVWESLDWELAERPI